MALDIDKVYFQKKSVQKTFISRVRGDLPKISKMKILNFCERHFIMDFFVMAIFEEL